MTPVEISTIRSQLADGDLETRTKVIRQLKSLGPEATQTLPYLWDITFNDLSKDIRFEACMAIWAIENDRQDLTSRIKGMLRSDDRDQLLASLYFLDIAEFSEIERREFLDHLWAKRRTGELKGLETQCLQALLTLADDDQRVVLEFLTDDSLTIERKIPVLISPELGNLFHQLILFSPDQLMPEILNLLETKDRSLQEELMAWLANLTSSLPSTWQECLLETIWHIVRVFSHGFTFYCQLSSQDQALHRLINDPAIPQENVGAVLLQDSPPGMLQQFIEVDVQKHLPYVLEALVHPDWEIRAIAAQWIGQLEMDLSADLYDQCADSLEQRVRGDVNNSVKISSEDALASLQRRRHGNVLARMRNHLSMLRDEHLDEETRVKAMESLVRMESRDAITAIIHEWIEWLDMPGHLFLRDFAEKLIRNSEHAVLPLLTTLELLDDRAPIDHLSSGGIASWKQDVCRRIVRLLSEMSEARFYNSDFQQYDSMLQELRNHAVPVLARRFPKEADVRLREDIACLLTRVGGNQSAAVIRRAIGDEERTRQSRQELLATYYLDPAKKQSEQAAQILEDAVLETRRTMRTHQHLNILLFGVGLFIISVGLTVALIGEENASRIFGTTTSLAAFSGLIIQLVHNPMDRIQSSVSRLIQIETLFTGFIWELNLNSTYIQSLYVAEGILSDESIDRAIDRIDKAIKHTVELAQLPDNTKQNTVMNRSAD